MIGADSRVEAIFEPNLSLIKWHSNLISSIKALLRGYETGHFIIIKWHVSLGNPFWSSMIFCQHNMAIGAKKR
jgi:hypothetical protein